MDDDDSYLYGESAEDVKPAAVQTTVPQPISLETTRSVSQGLVAKLEEQAADAANAANGAGEDEEPAENGGDEEEDEDDSDEDVEIIMEEPQSRRTLDLRPTRQATRSTSQTFTTPQRAQPPPSLTTEYTPRERGTLTKQSSSTPQPASQAQTPLPPVAATPGTTEKLAAEGEKQETKDAGPDPNTLPPATAPPSHPSINPSAPGIFDGRSILEVDLNALADKPWRRPGSDISDWFNYGFDEISWEAYCYRRRELGELAGMLKNNVVNFAGMSEDQLIALPPEVRAMVMAGATTVMAGGGGGGGGGMMPPGAGMNMNGGPMMNQMMNMGGMMNPMMEMGVGMGDMGMMQEGGAGGGGGQGGGQGSSEGQVGMGMGVGEGFGPGGGPQGQGMMGMGMNPEFGMQDPSGMGQQMYPGMEGNNTPTPIPTGPSRGVAQAQFRGRGMAPGMGRGRGAGFAGRGRGIPVRPASPLPPNVPTGPRNKNKYKDIDGSAPAVDGLDYGGGGGGGGEKDRSERSERSERDHKDRKAASTPDVDERDSRSRKRRGSPGEREESSRSSKRR